MRKAVVFIIFSTILLIGRKDFAQLLLTGVGNVSSASSFQVIDPTTAWLL